MARAEDVAARYPDTNEGWSVRARYLRDAWIPPVTRLAAGAQIVLVGFVLLIVCANVANLMLARASARRYETVMKGALGATRGGGSYARPSARASCWRHSAVCWVSTWRRGAT